MPSCISSSAGHCINCEPKAGITCSALFVCLQTCELSQECSWISMCFAVCSGISTCSNDKRQHDLKDWHQIPLSLPKLLPFCLLGEEQGLRGIWLVIRKLRLEAATCDAKNPSHDRNRLIKLNVQRNSLLCFACHAFLLCHALSFVFALSWCSSTSESSSPRQDLTG